MNQKKSSLYIHSHREIVSGPGRHDWLMAIIHPKQDVSLGVRGLMSTCDCSRGDKCYNCRDNTPAWIRIVSTFNSDMAGDHWLFLAVMSQNLRKLRKMALPAAEFEKGAPEIPFWAQLVYGMYNPSLSGQIRGWMAPCPHDINNLFRSFHNLGTTKISRSVTYADIFGN